MAGLAIWVPGQGWIDLPANKKAMIAQGLTFNPCDMVGLNPMEIAPERAQIHLPLMMTEVFDLGDTGRAGQARQCRVPQSAAKVCTRSKVQLAGVQFAYITHDALGRAVIVAFSAEPMFGLDFGTYDVKRPPGR